MKQSPRTMNGRDIVSGIVLVELFDEVWAGVAVHLLHPLRHLKTHASGNWFLSVSHELLHEVRDVATG